MTRAPSNFEWAIQMRFRSTFGKWTARKIWIWQLFQPMVTKLDVFLHELGFSCSSPAAHSDVFFYVNHTQCTRFEISISMVRLLIVLCNVGTIEYHLFMHTFLQKCLSSLRGQQHVCICVRACVYLRSKLFH